MAYLRRRPRIAPNGRVSVRLTPSQRDLFTGAATVPKSVVHALRNAHVLDGKLSIRIDRDALESLIVAAAEAAARNPRTDNKLGALVRYLESLEDRFADDETHSSAEDDARV